MTASLSGQFPLKGVGRQADALPSSQHGGRMQRNPENRGIHARGLYWYEGLNSGPGTLHFLRCPLDFTLLNWWCELACISRRPAPPTLQTCSGISSD